MGRYINWADVVGRYPEVATLGGADELSSSHIVYAEAFVDGVLRSHYTTPFSGTNMVVKDLTIDVCYYRAAGRKIDDAVSVWSAFWANVKLIKKGELTMVDDNGNVIEQTRVQPVIYSNVQSYHSAFGSDDPINWSVDRDQQCDDEGSRS